MSDLLDPIFLIPRSKQGLYIKDCWPIGGPLGQILCKQVFFLTPRVVSIGSSRFPYLFAMKLEYSRGLECGMHWNGVFGETLSFKNYFLTFSVVFTFIPCVLIAILYIIIFLKLKSKKIPGEQSTNI